MNDVGLGLFDHPSDLFEICRERQRDALVAGRHGGEYRIGPSDRKLPRERTIADEYPDMIDAKPGRRESFLRSLNLIDLHEHVAAPNK